MKRLCLILTIILLTYSFALAQPGMGVLGGQPGYLVNENFTTALSAGAVNGTAVEPGPGGTRTVADTEAKITLSSGKLTFAGGKATPALGDPGLQLSTTYARVSGLTALQQFYCAGNTVTFGLGNGTVPGSTVRCGVYVSGTTMLGSVNGSTVPTLGTLTVGQNYWFAEILRTNGFYLLAKGGTEFPNWTLLLIDATNTTTPLTPMVRNYNSAATFDFWRAPTLLWRPLPVAGDSFGGTFPTTDGKGHWYNSAGTDLNSAEGVSGAELTWANSGGNTWAISSGTLVNTPLAAADYLTALPTTVSNLRVAAHVWRTAGTAGLFLNLDSIATQANYIKIYHDGTNVKADEIVGGAAPVNKLSAAATYVAGAALVAIKESATTIRVLYNGANVGSLTTVTSNVNTLCGLYSDNAGNSFDNFTAYPIGTQGQWSYLDRYIY